MRPGGRLPSATTAALICVAVAACSGKPAPTPPAWAGGKPTRIMSLNQCTDMLVLQLVPKERISSITYLAPAAMTAASAVLDPALVKGVRINRGWPEEVLGERPDMLISGDFTTPVTRDYARRMSIPLIEVKSANTFEDIRAITRQVGAAVGEPERAEFLVARMDAVLQELAAEATGRTITAAAWTGAGRVPGRGSLAHAVMRAAGVENIAAKLPDARQGTYDLEELIVARPEILVQTSNRAIRPSLSVARGQHPVLQKLYAGRRYEYPDIFSVCGLPQSAEAARLLRRAVLQSEEKTRP